MIVVWRIDTHCNLACGFCAYDRRLDVPRQRVAAAPVAAFLDVLGEWSRQRAQPVLVSWLGGEPTRWPHWKAMSRHARARGLRVSLTSNGTGLQQEAARAALIEHLDELTLSLDALGTTHDQLRGWPSGSASVLAAIRALAEARAARAPAFKLRVNVVLMQRTLAGFAALGDALAAAGVDELSFNALGGRDRPEFHASEALRVADIERLRAALPAWRQRWRAQGMRLCGDAHYLDRLQQAAAGIAVPVADCAPGRHFLFIDEHGTVAPCAYTAADYGLPLSALQQPADLDALPARWRQARAQRRAADCADCPSTQWAGKFALAMEEMVHGH